MQAKRGRKGTGVAVERVNLDEVGRAGFIRHLYPETEVDLHEN